MVGFKSCSAHVANHVPHRVSNHVPRTLVSNHVPHTLVSNRVPHRLVSNHVPHRLVSNHVPHRVSNRVPHMFQIVFRACFKSCSAHVLNYVQRVVLVWSEF